MYHLKKDGVLIEVLDCIYDLNGEYGHPKEDEPEDGDLHQLDTDIQEWFESNGYVIEEVESFTYYLGELFIRNGEYEYYAHFKFKLPKNPGLADETNPMAYVNKVASDYYGEADQDDHNGIGYYFHCGCVYVEGRNYQEVTKETFDNITILGEL